MTPFIILSLLLTPLLFSFSNAAIDPNSVYESLLECLPSQTTESADTLSSIVFSSTANTSSYTTVLQAYIRNQRLNQTSTPKPIVIITPTTESEIQAAILCSKKVGVQIKIRSGGHDYEGISYISNDPNFIVLDMFNFRDIDVNIDTETAVVGAGAQLGELYYRIYEKSKVHAFPAGVCPTVGVGGHISGGGYGTMIRKYGLTVDHVIDAKIVDVKGRILDRKSMGEDLFWAIRGGGGGSFGVILSYTVKLVQVPKVNTIFRIMKFVSENASELVYKWQSVMSTIDDDLFIRVLLQPVTVNGTRVGRASFIAHYLGDSDSLVSLLTDKFPELGLKKEDCVEGSWIDSVLYWANFDNTAAPEILLNRQSDSNFGKRKSDYVQTPISVSGIRSIFSKLVELGRLGFVFNPYGGQMNRVAADATPMPHRAGNIFKIQYSIGWSDPDPELERNYLNQTRVMYEFMTPFVSKNPRGTFLNYRDLDIGVMTGAGTGEENYKEGQVYGEKYFMGNFDRLVKIKTAVDPDNFFRNEQSIPVLPGKSSGKSRKMMK